MKDLDISYENYANGIIIADYSDENMPRFCGKSFTWSGQPLVNDPFYSKSDAEEAAHKYFTGE